MNHQNLKKIILIFSVVFLITSNIFAQQITINRIEKMPNKPSPYEMRNWKQVAIGYDSLVFDFNRTGQYLPLVWSDANSVNYPNHSRFGLHTVVGTPHPTAAEAINVIPAVISASLVGIDKSNQNGKNWVLMCEEFFNRRADENVYLNGPVSKSGHDWWYDTMPNVFFYQLYNLYPNTGDFEYQFTTVADRWLEAVENMGGSIRPWQSPYMNYRAWTLSTMTPLETGVTEPEAAGAIGWLLYNAYVKTGKTEYRIGAEWCMEFLNKWPLNPSYELQLPYGVYTAARMNAELGTTYNIEKMVNWCFNANDNVRNWGATLGNWGGYDCYGLIGEAKFAGYAFNMNGFEMAGALVPMVRYDDRFARAIGKWMLNLACATRLLYSKYLPDDHQDNENWARQYDPHSYIGYEALREYALQTFIKPYATGDFMRNSWAQTNLALYGSSHVGIFGGIIDTTNIEIILQLDVRKTDYFQNESYPTYLYFNPYNEEKTVQIDIGSGQHDIYDAVSNSFLQNNVSSATSLTIPADAAILLVVTPANGTITYDLGRMLIDGIVVDYQSGQSVANYPPRIKSLSATDEKVIFGENTILYCTAVDRDNDELSYAWNVSKGVINGDGPEVTWTVPDSAGIYNVSCLVYDGNGGSDTANVNVEAVEYINQLPFIQSIIADPKKIGIGTTTSLICEAGDPDDDNLTYAWSSQYGTLSGSGSNVTWTAPNTQGYYFITCSIDDGRSGYEVDSIGVVVLDFANIQTGVPVAYYPFNGNANDESGFNNQTNFYGVSLVEDRFGNTNSAYYFDGLDDHIRVRSNRLLNFQDEITVSFWMKVEEFFSREAYPISHGNWENRWKVSISPGTNSLRWTVKTQDGIKDLDSQTKLVLDTYYNVTVLYDGANYDIYINGVLDNHSIFSGKIMTTSIDLTIGQVVPSNTRHNFKGVLDDIRIYDYALSVEEIQNIYNENTLINEPQTEQIPSKFSLKQNYPNPFNAQTTIQYQISEPGKVSLKIFDILGKRVRTLVNIEKSAGYYSVTWDSKNDNGSAVTSGIYIYELKSQNFCQRKKLILVK